MRAFSYPAGVGVGDECGVKEGVESAVERMVEQAVAHACFVDVAGFWVTDAEVTVATVYIGFVLQLPVKQKNIVHEPVLELLHILFFALTTHELLPGGEQILHRDDILVCMSELHTTSEVNPPPQTLAGFGASQTSLLVVA